MAPRLLARARRLLLGPPVSVDLEPIRYVLGSIEARTARTALTLRDAEFRAFSQFGEDGIIQWLIARVPIDRERFVEIGAGHYGESNTRFLLEHDNWTGTVIDSGEAHIRYLAGTDLAWRHTIECVSAFVTCDNVNDLVGNGDLGLLSIDIDGNDYWVWEAITAVSPRIVVCEYNSLFGPDRAVSIPYDAAFDRFRAHHSGLYFGASLAALAHLAGRRGYRLVGSNQAGNDAFFIRDDVAADLLSLTALDAWNESRFREARDLDGRLTYRPAHRSIIAALPLVDVSSGESLTVGEI